MRKKKDPKLINNMKNWLSKIKELRKTVILFWYENQQKKKSWYLNKQFSNA